MAITYCTVTTDDELKQILLLQRANHPSNLSIEQAKADGFVTVVHSFELLKKMTEAAPQIIARDGSTVVGYALVMLDSFSSLIPVLQPFFDRLGTIRYEGDFVTNKTFYVMGQICVHEPYRGMGVFDALYLTHKEILCNVYDLCVTSVSTRNSRSMKAHQRVGFELVNTFQDATDEWNVLVWNFKGEKTLNKLFHRETL
jgi:hypothetical protein